jgi:hypothetical protein
MRIKVSFPFEKVQMLRAASEAACNDAEGLAEGWSVSDADPMKLLNAFPALRIRKGYCLKAYQYKSDESRNTVVWAVPVGSVFSLPAVCRDTRAGVLEPPKPEGALDDMMQAIEGDGSPWSYMCSTIFARETSEFGAEGQGFSWRTHMILGRDPLCFSSRSEKWNPLGPLQEISQSFEGWKWMDARPSEWRPSVYMAKDAVQVVFHTFSGLGCQAIYRFCDTYDPDSYCFISEEKILAAGPGGFKF